MIVIACAYGNFVSHFVKKNFFKRRGKVGIIFSIYFTIPAFKHLGCKIKVFSVDNFA